MCLKFRPPRVQVLEKRWIVVVWAELFLFGGMRSGSLGSGDDVQDLRQHDESDDGGVCDLGEREAASQLRVQLL